MTLPDCRVIANGSEAISNHGALVTSLPRCARNDGLANDAPGRHVIANDSEAISNHGALVTRLPEHLLRLDQRQPVAARVAGGVKFAFVIAHDRLHVAISSRQFLQRVASEAQFIL